jgi:hypothetical protein
MKRRNSMSEISDVPKVNPLLQKVKLPGRIFQLPSRGIFYQDGELSSNVKDGEIHVHAMSAIDEINMKNPDMLFSGKAIEEVCKTCIPDILKPHKLLARDVDAIMLFLRSVTYGNFFEVEIQHTCPDAKKQTYSLNIETLISGMRYLDPTMTDQNYAVNLPNDQVVHLQPARAKSLCGFKMSGIQVLHTSSIAFPENSISGFFMLISSIADIACT